jgi:hypothetical protein
MRKNWNIFSYFSPESEQRRRDFIYLFIKSTENTVFCFHQNFCECKHNFQVKGILCQVQVTFNFRERRNLIIYFNIVSLSAATVTLPRWSSTDLHRMVGDVTRLNVGVHNTHSSGFYRNYVNGCALPSRVAGFPQQLRTWVCLTCTGREISTVST